jgi:hypothetical protein
MFCSNLFNSFPFSLPQPLPGGEPFPNPKINNLERPHPRKALPTLTTTLRINNLFIPFGRVNSTFYSSPQKGIATEDYQESGTEGGKRKRSLFLGSDRTDILPD